MIGTLCSIDPAVLHPRLLDAPMVALSPLGISDANRLLLAWGHNLGPCNRPYTQRAYALELDGEPISLAMSGSMISEHARGVTKLGEALLLLRSACVELTRLCSAPGYSWATRVMLRLWREVCAPRWPDWEVKAAVSYSQNALHAGNIYRLDGWERINEHCGTGSGGGSWTRKRYAGDAAAGSKSLWVWRYA